MIVCKEYVICICLGEAICFLLNFMSNMLLNTPQLLKMSNKEFKPCLFKINALFSPTSHLNDKQLKYIICHFGLSFLSCTHVSTIYNITFQWIQPADASNFCNCLCVIYLIQKFKLNLNKLTIYKWAETTLHLAQILPYSSCAEYCYIVAKVWLS